MKRIICNNGETIQWVTTVILEKANKIVSSGVEVDIREYKLDAA